jgi:hypothetical protein
MLTAQIHDVTLGKYDMPQIHFSLHDGEDTGMVSFEDTIGLAHATFLIEHSIVTANNAYGRMLNAFIGADHPQGLVGQEFIDVEENEE